MTTTYDGELAFEDCLRGASLVVEGVVEEVLEARYRKDEETPIRETVFRVRVNRVLNGEPPKKTLRVRVASGGTEETDPDRKRFEMSEGDRVLLVLAPDYGRAPETADFVPYFSPPYRVSANGNVDLAGEDLPRVEEKQEGVRGRWVALDDLERLVKGILKVARPDAEARERKEAPDRFELVGEDPVAELPEGKETGARPVSPDDFRQEE